VLSTYNPYVIQVTGNQTIIANFDVAYNLTITTDGNGSVKTNQPNTTNLIAGTQVVLTATPNLDYKFKNWTDAAGVVLSNIDNPYVYTVTKDEIIKANFEYIGGQLATPTLVSPPN
jgi:hypothetical protein